LAGAFFAAFCAVVFAGAFFAAFFAVAINPPVGDPLE
jgi:hypothetical protein